MELVVVMAVTVMLTGMLLPALTHLRENAHRVICSSNLRQTGLASVIYADDHFGKLPPSYFGEPGNNKAEMMAVHRGKIPDNWEGLGWLYFDMYCRVPGVFYCPSHTGEHFYDRYEELYLHPGAQRIYTNYHYAGDADWETGQKRRLRDESLVIATDGLRTLRDFNHRTGVNLLRGDCSVRWRDDISQAILESVPASAMEDPDDDPADEVYSNIWDLLGSPPE